jgi:Pyruvate/2-oxoacid:ferredoxin oxidoreductase gamma subunit
VYSNFRQKTQKIIKINTMKQDIILAGVGGQGIVSIASVIGLAALNENLFVKQSEVHGMSQRGGAVMSHLRISFPRQEIAQ